MNDSKTAITPSTKTDREITTTRRKLALVVRTGVKAGFIVCRAGK